MSNPDEHEEQLLAKTFICPFPQDRQALASLTEAVNELKLAIPTSLKGVEVELAGVKGEVTLLKKAVDKTNGTVLEHTRDLEVLKTARVADISYKAGVAEAKEEIAHAIEEERVRKSELTAALAARREARLKLAKDVFGHELFRYGIAGLAMGAGLGGIVEIMQKIGAI